MNIHADLHLYKDIQVRTGGEIYIGVVGPVRTGKSTFIKRFMDLLVLPNMISETGREQARDELPQAASGKTIMTTEPKFIPKEAAEIKLAGDITAKIRLIDCVGYMVEGASGHEENGEERQVRTPWFEQEIPFTKAAAVGTHKVICDHATIGIVVTTDGTIGELERERYLAAEERTIKELKSIGKPFVILVNTAKPYGKEALETAQYLSDTYQTAAMPVNCEQLREEDIYQILEEVLLAFPVSEVQFYVPKWLEMLPGDHPIKEEILLHIRELMSHLDCLKDTLSLPMEADSPYIEKIQIVETDSATGVVQIRIEVPQDYYYQVLSELTGTAIRGEYDLIRKMREWAMLEEEYEKVNDAFSMVRIKGYGVVSPKKDEITLEEPMLIHQGNKYGVKIRSQAPSVHMIRAIIENEIAPIVGNEQQAKDLIDYIKDAEKEEGGMWKTSIFGKSLESMVLDGMNQKIAQINEASQEKLQDSMQKIVNDSNGGMVCIII